MSKTSYWAQKDKRYWKIRLTFVKKTSIQNPVESPKYIKCYSQSSPRPIKSSRNSVRYNCQKSAVDREDLKPYWKREKATFLYVINKPTIYKFFKDFTNDSKKTNMAVVFSQTENFLENYFVLSDTEGNTSRLLNSRGIADLPLLWILLEINQKS